MEKLICLNCNGLGYTSEHANHPHSDGDCYGECPVKTECLNCDATGYITGEILLRREYEHRVRKQLQEKMDKDDLPF